MPVYFQEKVNELSGEFEIKKDELTNFQDNVTALINEKDDLAMKSRKQKDDLKKLQV